MMNYISRACVCVCVNTLMGSNPYICLSPIQKCGHMFPDHDHLFKTSISGDVSNPIKNWNNIPFKHPLSFIFMGQAHEQPMSNPTVIPWCVRHITQASHRIQRLGLQKKTQAPCNHKNSWLSPNHPHICLVAQVTISHHITYVWPAYTQTAYVIWYNTSRSQYTNII